jgi:FkbM family methyltransferase
MRPGLSFVAHGFRRDDLAGYDGRSLEHTAAYDCFLSLARGKERLLDVGAYHAFYALTFCAINPSGSAIVIEPIKLLSDVARKNIALNGFNIAVIECAAASASGIVHGRIADGMFNASYGKNASSFPARTIDEICKERGFVPDMIKIDTEGHELQVLKGAVETLSRKPLLMVEVHPGSIPKTEQNQSEICSLTELYNLISAAGYGIEDLCGMPLNLDQFAGHRGLLHVVCR